MARIIPKHLLKSRSNSNFFIYYFTGSCTAGIIHAHDDDSIRAYVLHDRGDDSICAHLPRDRGDGSIRPRLPHDRGDGSIRVHVLHDHGDDSSDHADARAYGPFLPE